MRRTLVVLVVVVGVSGPAAAQDPPALSIRPFVMAATQSFAAAETFEATFQKTRAPFFGGGVQVVVLDQFVVEIGASRFRQTGERVFRSGGTNFRLGIPLTATITPVEVTGGYRFPMWEQARPYVAAGVGSYAYSETSDFADPPENVDTRRTGFVVNGGFEFRLHRWVGASADLQYSRVRGILGVGGVSQQLGENDLGGIAARFKFIVGR
jgi:opacity protein-like surface antigen